MSASFTARGEEVSTLKRLSLEELMEVEVTSVSRRPERLSDVASAIQVIRQEDIRRSGATSIPEALRLVSNLHVAQTDARQWAISARGFNSTTANKLLVLIDGRTVYTPLYAGVFWDVQDTLLEDVDRIEVISGPGATQWGANAVNGVINIVTKSARQTQGPLISAIVGNELEGMAGIRYGGEVADDFAYRVYAKYFDRDGPVLPNGNDIARDASAGQGGFRIDGDLSRADTLTVQGDFYEGSFQQPASQDVEVKGANLLGRWTRILDNGSDLQLQVYFDRTERDIPGSFKQRLHAYDVDFQHHLPWGERHNVVWGFSFRRIDDDIDNGPEFGFLPPDVTREWWSAFVQDDIALSDALRLTIGSKFEHNEYTDVEAQPSVRLSWRFDDRSLLWSAVSKAMRTPSRIDREFYAPSSPPFFILQGGPNFHSEELISYEVGYRTQPHDRLLVSISGFYNDYDDLRSIERIDAAAPFPVVIGNGLTGETYGVEITLDYVVTDAWRLSAGHTELRESLRNKPDSTDAAPGSGEANDPKRHSLLRSSLDIGSSWQFDATFRHVGRIDRQNVPSYGELDLRLAWRPTSTLELSLVGQNLLHDHHPEFGALAAAVTSTRNEIERSAYLKAVWRLR